MKLAEMINNYHFSVQFEIILSLNRDVVVYDSFVKLFWPIHIPSTYKKGRLGSKISRGQPDYRMAKDADGSNTRINFLENIKSRKISEFWEVSSKR